MIKILYGFILLTSLSLIACSSTETAVDQSVTSNEEASENIASTIDSTTSIVILLNSSNPYNGKFQFDSTSAGWQGVLETYQMVNDTMNIVGVNPLQPKVDWDEFNDFVNYLQIFTLPDQKSIGGYSNNPLGSQNNPFNVQIEFQVRRANGYKHQYIYSNPAIETNEYWQSANVITFVSYITTEFEINNPVLPQE